MNGLNGQHMGALVRCIINNKPHWLAKISDAPINYSYVTDRARAYVFSTRETAQQTAFAPDRASVELGAVQIIPVTP
jgi:hypothetical protein